MTLEETVWLAGLYEGEGSVHLSPHMRGTGHVLHLSIGSTDLDVVETAGRVTGVGKVKLKRKATATTKTMYVWLVCDRQEVVTVLEAIFPYLHSRRREQVLPVLEHCKLQLLTRRPAGAKRRTREETKKFYESLDKRKQEVYSSIHEAHGRSLPFQPGN